MRTGYFTTPFSATRSPNSSSSGSSLPSIMPRNSATSSDASSTDLPVTASVSIDALAWLIEQPCP